MVSEYVHSRKDIGRFLDLVGSEKNCTKLTCAKSAMTLLMLKLSENGNGFERIQCLFCNLKLIEKQKQKSLHISMTTMTPSNACFVI